MILLRLLAGRLRPHRARLAPLARGGAYARLYEAQFATG